MKYHITVQTSDLRGAGTDAAVSIQLFGAAGESGRLPLAADGGGGARAGSGQAAAEGRAPFARGACDEFTVAAEGVGGLRKIWIGHDNRGKRSMFA